MTNTYVSPTPLSDYRPSAVDSTDGHPNPATVPADRRRAIASKSWLLAPDLREPRVYASTIPAGYRGSR